MYLFPAWYMRAGDVMVALAWYFLAKVLEAGPLDDGLHSAGRLMSGHRREHLAALLGDYRLIHVVRDRRPLLIATHS
jgi:hypothetical protein